MSERSELIDRIWERDPTVWTGGDEAKWLGWLDEPRAHARARAELAAFADEVAGEGLDAVVLLGMGGSSLAPEVLRRTFRAESLPRARHDAPAGDPRARGAIDLERTLFVCSSKSGDDARDALARRLLLEATGERGGRFVAVTDPGSDLERLAQERGFRRVFAGEPTIGGRYSALSPFGMVPAALMGVDVDRLLAAAEEMADACRPRRGQPRLRARAPARRAAGARVATRSASRRPAAGSGSGRSS